MTQTNLTKILTRRYDVGREIKFILYKDELLSDPIDLTDYTVVITVIKPDNNFVIENFVGDTVTITDQMEVVTGTGYYCVHVTKGTETIYTGQGEFIIDDVLISDDELESISEVNGLKFPDDFITVEDHVAVIDDTVTTTEKTWSSSKISDEIENVSVVVSKTAEGNPIEISDGASAPLVECVTQITGSQDLHGYDKPWVGGSGKNKIPILLSEVKSNNTYGTWSGNTYSYADVTLVVDANDDGYVTKVTVNGTSSSAFSFYLKRTPISFDTATILNGCPNGGGDSTYDLRVSGGYKDIGSGVTIPANTSFSDTWIVIRSGISFSNLAFYPMIRISTESDATFAPYSNICPITAYTEGEIEVRGKNLLDESTVVDGDDISNVQIESGTTATDYEPYTSTTHTTTYPSAIYRGSEDVVNGEVVTEWGMIASYAGESLPGEWISDRDEYAPGTTPTTGAQVAYELATPTTTSVTPTNLPIKSLNGYNHIESSTGEMEVEYITEDCQPLVDSIVMESERKITKLWDAGFTPSPGVWLEYDFGEDLENYDAIVILFVVSGWEGNNADSVTVYPKIQHLNTTKYYHYIKGTDYGIQFWRVSGTTYGLGSIDGNYPPQYKAVYGIKY